MNKKLLALAFLAPALAFSAAQAQGVESISNIELIRAVQERQLTADMPIGTINAECRGSTLVIKAGAPGGKTKSVNLQIIQDDTIGRKCARALDGVRQGDFVGTERIAAVCSGSRCNAVQARSTDAEIQVLHKDAVAPNNPCEKWCANWAVQQPRF